MDLKQHILRHMAFSHATFGPGQRMEGVLDHITKEIEEVRESNGESSEWVDLVILSLDGLTRRLMYSISEEHRNDPEQVAEMVCNMIVGKQTKNEGRIWPDWRTADPTKAIEHDRTGEVPDAELEALRKLSSAVVALRKTAPVDPDFPEMMDKVDLAISNLKKV